MGHEIQLLAKKLAELIEEHMGWEAMQKAVEDEQGFDLYKLGARAAQPSAWPC